MKRRRILSLLPHCRHAGLPLRAGLGRRRAVLCRRQRYHPLTLTVFPTYSGGTLYVPYQVFDSQPLRRHAVV